MAQENEKKMTTNQLDDVAGGTATEYNDFEILRSKGILEKRCREAGVGKVYGYANILNKLGIESDLSEGFLGIGSVNNTYRDKETGQMILHSEVVEYLKTGEKTWRK